MCTLGFGILRVGVENYGIIDTQAKCVRIFYYYDLNHSLVVILPGHPILRPHSPLIVVDIACGSVHHPIHQPYPLP